MQSNIRDLDELIRAGAIVHIPWQLIMPDKRQPRRYFNKGRMNALTEAIREGSQKLPAVVRPLASDPDYQFRLVDGERRYRSAKALNQPVPCLIREFASEEEVLEFQVQANFNRDGHTPMETCDILHRLLATRRIQNLPKPDQLAALGRFFGQSEGWARRYLNLRRLHPKLQRLVEPRVPKHERIPVTLAVKLSGYDQAQQLDMLNRIKQKRLNFKGASRLIDKANLQKGLHMHRRGRRPSDDFDILLRLAHRIQEEVATVMSMTDFEFSRMFKTRGAVPRKQMIDELNMAAQSVDRLRDRVRQTMREVSIPSVA